jgi:hypothetical protein
MNFDSDSNIQNIGKFGGSIKNRLGLAIIMLSVIAHLDTFAKG